METAAAEIGREMRVPGFRSGKVPAAGGDPPGGPRGGARRGRAPRAPGWYEEAINEAGITTVGDPKIDLDDLPEKGSPLAFLHRGRGRPACQARRLQGHRGRPPRAGGRPRGGRRPSSSACASRSPRSRPSSARPRRRLRGHGLRRHASTARSSRAARRRGYVRRARLGPPGARLRGAARGRGAGEEREVESPSPTTTRPSTWPARTPSSPSTVKEVKEKRLPELDDELADRGRRATTRSTSCAPTSSSASARPTSARSRASSARPPWTPPWPAPRSRSRTSWSTPRPTRCGTGPPAGWPRRASTRSATSSSPARPRRSS